MKEFKKLLNETNDTRLKIYFSLSELKEITGLSIRALKYRMLKIKLKYEGVPSLLYKKCRTWNIHYTVIKEFFPQYNTKVKTLYTYDWVSMATWNPLFNYDINYHLELVNQIKSKLPNHTISYAVEIDNRGVNHTHLISDADTKDLDNAVTSTIREYIENPYECRIEIEPIQNKYSAVEYLKKAPLSSGLLQ
jgi:hypothetical protein